MAKFNPSMLPTRPQPTYVRDLTVGETRYVSPSDISALTDGTALVSTRAFVHRWRSFHSPVSVTRTSAGWKVEVPPDFRIWSTRSYKLPNQDEIHEIVVGERRPEPNAGTFLGLLVDLARLTT